MRGVVIVIESGLAWNERGKKSEEKSFSAEIRALLGWELCSTKIKCGTIFANIAAEQSYRALSAFSSMLIAAINFHSVRSSFVFFAFHSQMICPRAWYCSTATINTQVIKCLIYMLNALWYRADYPHTHTRYLHACISHKWLNFELFFCVSMPAVVVMKLALFTRFK